MSQVCRQEAKRGEKSNVGEEILQVQNFLSLGTQPRIANMMGDVLRWDKDLYDLTT